MSVSLPAAAYQSGYKMSTDRTNNPQNIQDSHENEALIFTQKTDSFPVHCSFSATIRKSHTPIETIPTTDFLS